MAKFSEEWFHDVPALMQKTAGVYDKLREAGKTSGSNETTKKRIYEERGWLKRWAEPNFGLVLDRLKVFYLPKALRPGPAFVFPIRDLDGRYNQAQVRPFADSCLFMEDHKYRRFGTDRSFRGPQWFGNDPITLQKIIMKRKVCLVEGPFDALACKLLVPDAPLMSSLTKGITEDQIEYLRILGVEHITTLFDNDETNKAGAKGAHTTQYRVEKKFNSGITVSISTGSAADPSDALKKEATAIELMLFLRGL